jgi:hypothetical protein
MFIRQSTQQNEKNNSFYRNSSNSIIKKEKGDSISLIEKDKSNFSESSQNFNSIIGGN